MVNGLTVAAEATVVAQNRVHSIRVVLWPVEVDEHDIFFRYTKKSFASVSAIIKYSETPL